MKKLTGIVLLVLSFFSCAKSTDTVPYVRVNIIIQKADPRFGQSSVLLLNGGVAGIILYKRANNDYVAYDRCSPYQPEKLCKVEVDNTGIQVEDPCSGSKFLLFDGSVVKAPATRSLRTYTVAVTNYEIHISN